MVGKEKTKYILSIVTNLSDNVDIWCDRGLNSSQCNYDKLIRLECTDTGYCVGGTSP